MNPSRPACPSALGLLRQVVAVLAAAALVSAAGCDPRGSGGKPSGPPAESPVPAGFKPDAVPEPPPQEFGTSDMGDPRPQRLDEATMIVKGRRLTVMVARTEPQRNKGLMFRRGLAADAGMIFLFPATRTDAKFWNHNVPIELDLAFADETGKIVHTLTMPARSDTSVGPPAGTPVRYVLEMAGGYLSRHGIAAGDRFEFSDALKAVRAE
jgi:uncharacterized membrane protein (UPF0127 family)